MLLLLTLCNNPDIASLPPTFEFLKIQTKLAKLNKVAKL
jgi:hypothetical protein